MRTLITGGAGFVGSHLCQRFIAEGHDALSRSDAAFAFSVTSYAFPIQRALRVTPEGRVDLLPYDWEPPETVLARVGLEPSQIERVLISHMHFDHINALSHFPDVELFVHPSTMPDVPK